MSIEPSAPSTTPFGSVPSTVPGTPPPATGKAPLPGWLLWFFLGCFGAHRFYFGKTGSGLGMAGLWLASTVTLMFGVGLFGFLALTAWWVYDAFQINKWARGEESAMNSSTSSGFEAPAAGATMLPKPPAATSSDIPSMSQPTSQSEAA